MTLPRRRWYRLPPEAFQAALMARAEAEGLFDNVREFRVATFEEVLAAGGWTQEELDGWRDLFLTDNPETPPVTRCETLQKATGVVQGTPADAVADGAAEPFDAWLDWTEADIAEEMKPWPPDKTST